jgi:predicted regulator of Ras-like GTPase activity (Roadblock/LC7/MglB family)
MFKEAIRDVVEGTDGGIAGILMDFEGIAVDSYVKGGDSLDINAVGAEFSVILKSIQRAIESLEAGGAREIAIQSDKVTTLIRILNDEYFLSLTLSPDGNFGKGRYLMRTAAPKLIEQLS